MRKSKCKLQCLFFLLFVIFGCQLMSAQQISIKGTVTDQSGEPLIGVSVPVPGTKIKVTGYKGEWAGEVEIMDANFEILEGSYIAEAVDVSTYLGLDDLANYQNQFVSFKGMTVETYEKDGVSYDCAFVYNDDNSGSHDSNSDLYFNVSLNGSTYTFCVESYLCDKDTDVYKAVENLKVGDVVDLEGFLYWYNGANPHITSVTVK